MDERHRETRELFDAFRSVFEAKNLGRRAIFWIEEGRGQFTVRHVNNLTRTQKGEDILVGKTIANIKAAKVLMGNFSAKCGLSTVRWEIFTDFELNAKVEMGRFDHVDLLSDMTMDDAAHLARNGIRPIGLWDFDAILLTHKCQKCGGLFDRTHLMFDPRKPCETCKREPTYDDGLEIMRGILRMHPLVPRVFTHPVPELPTFPVSNFANPAINSFVYWCVSHTQWMTILTQPEDYFKGFGAAPQRLFSQSILSLLRVEFLRNCFHEYLQGIGQNLDNWDIFTGAVKAIGNVLVSPKAPTPEDMKYLNLGRECVVELLPSMLDKLVRVSHQWKTNSYVLN